MTIMSGDLGYRIRRVLLTLDHIDASVENERSPTVSYICILKPHFGVATSDIGMTLMVGHSIFEYPKSLETYTHI